jgi:hypothetical protein
LSREANFMQGWQQTLVDERGGTNGQNYADLVKASHAAHEGTNPAKRAYNDVRTVRAIILGGAIFESLCQDALIEQSIDSAPATLPYEDIVAEVEPSTLDRLAPPFEGIVTEYMAALKVRTEQGLPEPLSCLDASFLFYEGAYSTLKDDYWRERIAAGDIGGGTTEEAHKAWEQSSDFNNYVVLALFGDNVAASTDVLVAMAAGLCMAKRRPCSAEELTEFIVENVDTATTVASTTRSQRKGPQAALPYGYGYKILQGDEQMLGNMFVKAIKEDGRWRAQWSHHSLRAGNWPRPGHCPASDYNTLQPRTEDELLAVEASLGTLGLSRLIEDNRVTSAQMVIAKALRISQASIFLDDEWQERLIHSHA